LAWNDYGTEIYYFKKPVDQPFTINLAPNGAPSSCDVAADSAGRLIKVDASAALWLKALDGEWYGPIAMNASSPIDPHIEAGQTDKWYFTYGSASGVVNQVSLPKTDTAAVSIYQTVTVPDDLHNPTLSFMYQLAGAAISNSSRLRISVTNGITSALPFAATVNTPAWTHGWADMSAWDGQVVTISIESTADQYFNSAYVDLDEISLGSWLTPAPQIVIPNRLDVMSSAVVTITGANFVSGSQVSLDDASLPDVHFISTSVLTAVVPPLAQGYYAVVVANPDGRAGTLPGALLIGHETYLPLIHK
jgi:hypothetical protein